MRFRARFSLLYVLLCCMPVFCHSETRLALCSAGLGSFSSKFTSGVMVTVDATKVGGFSTHTCEASLVWGKDVVRVAGESWQIDIDAMGADLGLGMPVVAFQLKDSAQDRLTTYKIYSLEKPPRLLRTITGADFFSASDANLEGRIEIWADDAGTVDGFDGIPLSSFDFAPTVVLRFEKQRLVDVSSEYQPYFDRQISQLKSQLDSRELDEFKESDGKLQGGVAVPEEKLRGLLTTKVKVLEIVWAYLYSGRDEEAWRTLAALWPQADLDRIRSAITDTRARGIRRQVDGVSQAGAFWKHHAQIYNMDTESDSTVDMSTGERTALASDMPSAGAGLGEKTSYSVDVKPEPIFLGTPQPLSQSGNPSSPVSTIYLNLVIDAAGKVRSAQLADKSNKGQMGDMLIGATTGWKFIPAFRDGRAVACRMRFGVWPYR